MASWPVASDEFFHHHLGDLTASCPATLGDAASTVQRGRTQYAPGLLCQICLSLLLVGVIDPRKSHKPFALILVLSQILSIFLIAWFLEWRAAVGQRLAVRGSVSA